MQLLPVSIDSNIIEFFYGFVSCLTDNYMDIEKTPTQTQIYITNILKGILICLTIYIVYFNKEIGLLSANVLSAGLLFTGVEQLLNNIKSERWSTFWPYADQPIYILMSLVAIPKALTNLHVTYTKIKTLDKNDRNNLIMIIIPTLVLIAGFWVGEHKLIREEISFRKLIMRFIIGVLLLIYIISSPFIQNKLHINPEHIKLLNYCAYGFIGAMASAPFRPNYTI